MKKLMILAAIFAAMFVSSCNKDEQANSDNSFLDEKERLYMEYIRTSEKLLWELEELCESEGIYWGDTVVEGDTFDEYLEARESLGLGYFKHYSEKE